MTGKKNNCTWAKQVNHDLDAHSRLQYNAGDNLAALNDLLGIGRPAAQRLGA